MKRPIDPDALLDRDQFHRSTLAWSHGRCLFCERRAVDAHHIFERKLFADGGYRLRNGAAARAECHWQAEIGKIGIPEAAAKALAPRGLLLLAPPHALSCGADPLSLDKWGNLIRPDKSLAPGPLFEDAGRRAAMAHGGMLGMCYDAGDFPWAAAASQAPD